MDWLKPWRQTAETSKPVVRLDAAIKRAKCESEASRPVPCQVPVCVRMHKCSVVMEDTDTINSGLFCTLGTMFSSLRVDRGVKRPVCVALSPKGVGSNTQILGGVADLQSSSKFSRLMLVTGNSQPWTRLWLARNALRWVAGRFGATFMLFYLTHCNGNPREDEEIALSR